LRAPHRWNQDTYVAANLTLDGRNSGNLVPAGCDELADLIEP
jgi:hypothetical protein